MYVVNFIKQNELYRMYNSSLRLVVTKRLIKVEIIFKNKKNKKKIIFGILNMKELILKNVYCTINRDL